MVSKNKLKELSAYRMQKRCDEEAVFVVEGPKMCAEALASTIPIHTVCATAPWLLAHKHLSESRAKEVLEVSQAELERLSLMKKPCQAWLLADRPAMPPLSLPHPPLTLVLDRIQDPGNLGTILRTADWFGLRRVVCSPDTASCFNPKTVQASMGAIFRTAVHYTPLAPWLLGSNLTVYGASLQGSPLDNNHHTLSPAALVIGNESAGISPEVMQCVSHPLLIPNRGGTAESLNAAVAAAILIEKLIP